MGRLALLAALISATCGYRVLQPKELREKAIYELHKDRRGLIETVLGTSNTATNAWDTCDGCVGVCNGENKWYCRDLSEGQGSCESDEDCYEDLLCGKQNCSWWYAECACRDDKNKPTKPCGTFSTKKSCEKNTEQLGCTWHGTELDENVVCLLEDADPNKWDKKDNCCYSKEALTSAEAKLGGMDESKPIPPVQWFIITLCTCFGCVFLICLAYCLERMIKHKRHPFFWDGNKLCCVCYAIYGKTHKTQDHDVYKRKGQQDEDEQPLSKDAYLELDVEQRSNYEKAEKWKEQKIGCCPKNDPADAVCEGGLGGLFTGCCKFTTQEDGDGRCAWTVRCCVIRMDEGIKRHGWWMDDDDDIDERLHSKTDPQGNAIPRSSKFETTLEHKAKRKQYDELEKANYMKEAKKIKKELINSGYKGFEPHLEVQFKCCGIGKKWQTKILKCCPNCCYHCCCDGPLSMAWSDGFIMQDGKMKELTSDQATKRASILSDIIDEKNRKSRDEGDGKQMTLRMWGHDSIEPKDENEEVVDINNIPKELMKKVDDDEADLKDKKQTLRNILSLTELPSNQSNESGPKGFVDNDVLSSPSGSAIGSRASLPMGATASNPRPDDDAGYNGRKSLGPVGAVQTNSYTQPRNQTQEASVTLESKSEHSNPTSMDQPQVPLPTLPRENLTNV